MNRKLIVFIVAILVLGVLFWWSGRDQKAPQPEMPSITEMPETVAPPANPHGTELPTVESAVIAIQGGSGEDLGELTVKPNETIVVPGTDYSIRMTEFYTYWNWDSQPINLGYEEQNPTAKIEIIEDGKVLGYGWAFRNMEFFRMQMHGGPGGAASQLAFTLRTYEGLKFPNSATETGE